MRFIVLNHITATPDAPLSAAFRTAVRRGESVTRNCAVEPPASHRLSRGLVQFIKHANGRRVWLVSGNCESQNTAFACRAIERAMEAQLARGHRTQFVPVRLPALSLWANTLDNLDLGARVARTIEHDVSYELVERLSVLAKSEAQTEAVERVKTLLRGVVRYDALKERIVRIYGDTATGRVAARRVADALWLGLQIRANRVANDPAPWFLSELQRETDQLAADIESRHQQALTEVKLLENAVDIGLSSALGALTWAAGSLVTSGVSALGLAMIVGGGVALARFKRRDDAPVSGWSQLAGEFESEPPSAVTDRVRIDDPPDTRPVCDELEASALLHDYAGAARSAGVVPVLIIEQVADQGIDDREADGRLRRLLGAIPNGIAVVVVTDNRRRFQRVPEIDERLVACISLPEIHRYIEDRIPIEASLSGEARQRLGVERDLVRLATVHASHGRIDRVDECLAGLRGGQGILRLDSLCSFMVIRIRATLQLAQETIIRESQSEMTADGHFADCLPIALQLVGQQWAHGIAPRVSDAILHRHFAESSSPHKWTELSASTQQRLKTGTSKLVELCASRAWLASLLPSRASACAQLIPEWSLIIRRGNRWEWTFHHDGNPRFSAEQFLDLQQSSAARSIQGAGARKKSNSSLREDLSGVSPTSDSTVETNTAQLIEYLGDFTSPRRTTASVYPADENTQTYDSLAPQPIVSGAAPSAWDTAPAILDLIETLDDVLSGILDGQLTVSELTRCGLLPSIPSSATIRDALADDSDPTARYLLVEFGERLRERMGVLDKFILWLVAIKSLSSVKSSSIDVARALVASRDLRGRGAAEQHARLTIRSLQADLRRLCPSTRGASQVFRRAPASADGVESILRWGEDLQKRAEVLAWSLREGAPDTLIGSLAWQSMAQRLRSLTLDGERVLPSVAEEIAVIDGQACARLVAWSGRAPSVSQLSRIVEAPMSSGPKQALSVAKVSAALLLGLNRSGVQIGSAMAPDLSVVDPVLMERLNETGHRQRPLVVMVGMDPMGLTEHQPPSCGSVFVREGTDVSNLERIVSPDVLLVADGVELSTDTSIPVVRLPQSRRLDDAITWIGRYIGLE